MKEAASELNDTKLLKNVSCEDPIAQELKYHRKFYLTILNRVRSLKRCEERDNETDSENMLSYARAFAEVVTYIHEQKLLNSTNEPSVFKLTGLADLYTKRLTNLGILNPIVKKQDLRLRKNF